MKAPLPTTPDIEIDSQEVPWSGRATLRLVTFRHRKFDASWSAPITWELWQRGRAAAVLPYDPVRDLVLMIEQFRLPAHAAGHPPVMRELPAGMCDPGEDTQTTIRRELHEEAGVTARRMLPIGEFVLSPGASDETVFLYAGEIRLDEADDARLGQNHGHRDDSEDIRVFAVPAAQAIEDAAAGRLANSVAAIGLLWLGVRREWLRAQWA